jgi:hypothetical protein
MCLKSPQAAGSEAKKLSRLPNRRTYQDAAERMPNRSLEKIADEVNPEDTSGWLPPTASPARTALPTAHFDRNKIPAIFGDRAL